MPVTVCLFDTSQVMCYKAVSFCIGFLVMYFSLLLAWHSPINTPLARVPGRVRAGAEESMFARLSVRRAVFGAVDMLSPSPHHPQRVPTVLGADG